MGDPKKHRKKYKTPSHPWQKERIEVEKALIREYGLKTKVEIWKADSKVRSFKSTIKELIRSASEQAKKEENELMTRLQKIGILSEGASLDDILELTVKDFLERRLQTIVYRMGFARSMKQSRQFITHGHILVNDKKISAPSFIVSKEDKVTFVPGIPLAAEDHPERVLILKEEPIVEKTEEDIEAVENVVKPAEDVE